MRSGERSKRSAGLFCCRVHFFSGLLSLSSLFSTPYILLLFLLFNPLLFLSFFSFISSSSLLLSFLSPLNPRGRWFSSFSPNPSPNPPLPRLQNSKKEKRKRIYVQALHVEDTTLTTTLISTVIFVCLLFLPAETFFGGPFFRCRNSHNPSPREQSHYCPSTVPTITPQPSRFFHTVGFRQLACLLARYLCSGSFVQVLVGIVSVWPVRGGSSVSPSPHTLFTHSLNTPSLRLENIPVRFSERRHELSAIP